jgi:hypothetical protein
MIYDISQSVVPCPALSAPLAVLPALLITVAALVQHRS